MSYKVTTTTSIKGLEFGFELEIEFTHRLIDFRLWSPKGGDNLII